MEIDKEKINEVFGFLSRLEDVDPGRLKALIKAEADTIPESLKKKIVKGAGIIAIILGITK